jgi:hypothetical protein
MAAMVIPVVEFSIMVAVNELLVTDRAAVAEALAELLGKPEPCEQVLEEAKVERLKAAQVTFVLIVSAFREEPARKMASSRAIKAVVLRSTSKLPQQRTTVWFR